MYVQPTPMHHQYQLMTRTISTRSKQTSPSLKKVSPVSNSKTLSKKNPVGKTKKIVKKPLVIKSKNGSKRTAIKKVNLQPIPIIPSQKKLRSSKTVKNKSISKGKKSQNEEKKVIKSKLSKSKSKTNIVVKQNKIIHSNTVTSKIKPNLSSKTLLHNTKQKESIKLKSQRSKSKKRANSSSKSKSKGISKKNQKRMEIQKSNPKNTTRQLRYRDRNEKIQIRPKVDDKLKQKNQIPKKTKKSVSLKKKLKISNPKQIVSKLVNEDCIIIKQQTQTENVSKCIQQLRNISISKIQKNFLISAGKSDKTWSFRIMGQKGSLFDLTVNQKIFCNCLGTKNHKFCKHIEFLITKIAKLDNFDDLQTKSNLTISAYQKLDQALSQELEAIISTKDTQQRLKEYKNNWSDNRECKICFNQMPEKSQKLQNCRMCRNNFHDDCLRAWKQINITCPMCSGLLDRGQDDTDTLNNEQIAA